MECFEQTRNIEAKKIFVHEQIGNTINELVMKGRWVKNLNEKELSAFNKKLEEISMKIEELQ
jgi:hypothetical protein